MGYLKHKGYVGTVEYSEEDECLYGKVQGVANDCITYEGNDIAELKRDFEGAVDDYIALCEANRHIHQCLHTRCLGKTSRCNAIDLIRIEIEIPPFSKR